MNTCTRTITGLLLAATTAVALAVPASATGAAPAVPAAPTPPAVAPAASAVSTGTLIDAWYGDLLGRDADAGSQHWVNQVDAGAKPADVLWAITDSDEHHKRSIEISYEYYPGRTVDAAKNPGARYWLQGTNAQEFYLEWVYQNIIASPELVSSALHAGGKRQLVGDWYEYGIDAGRRPSNGEVAYWSARASEVGNPTASREIYYTPEAVSYRVQGTYTFLLQRGANAGEVAYWSPKEIESSINVDVLVAASPEHASIVDGTD